MCGIAGIVAPDARSCEEELARMLVALRHRGPDGSGSHFFRDCSLGHTRLSIVDLENGRQPMLSPAARTGVTFNGEIYGYQEIKGQLTGYPFRTSSDTEVILALYERYGEKMLSRLPGMFAFAIWDDAKQTLFCGRDRFGEKPFYFAYGRNGEFLFASEIKALLATNLFTPVLSLAAVRDYLRYLYVSPDRTIYENVHVLSPGHSLRWERGQHSIQQYWVPPPIRHDLVLGDAVEEFKSKFSSAVRRQLVADVPIGAFLSGGLDSSTIVAEAARHTDQVRTFSFAFEGALNEVPYAREVARLYKTDHTELATGAVDLGEMLGEMQQVYDEPLADSSNIPTYLLCKEARRHVKVVLTGDGGDELLAGYEWYKPLYAMAGQAKDLPLQRNALRVLRKCAELGGFACTKGLSERYLGMVYRKNFGSVLAAHRITWGWFTDREIAALGSLGDPSGLGPVEMSDTPGSLDDAIRYDISHYMVGDILVKIDRASMASGLELRSPFLDVEFAEFCMSLPYQLKLNGRDDKLLLREAYAKSWPPSVRKRSKQGFGAPVGKWLSQPTLRQLTKRCLHDSRHKIFELIDFDASRRFVEAGDYKTWILLTLAVWLERHDYDLPSRSRYFALEAR